MFITDVRKHYRFSPEAVEVVPVGDVNGLACRLACFETRQTLSGDVIGSPGHPHPALSQGERDNRIGPAAACYVIEGTGIFGLADEQPAEYVSAGGVVLTEAGTPWTITNPGPGRLVVMIVICG